MPGNLSLQFPYVKAIVETMGIAEPREGRLRGRRYDRHARPPVSTGGDAEVVVVTSDKDLMQLACDSVTISTA